MQPESFDVQRHSGVEYFVNLFLICSSVLDYSDFSLPIIVSRSFRWLCHRVPGEDKPGRALCPEEDVRQQWARSAGVQTGDSDYGEWLNTNVFIACSHALLFWFSEPWLKPTHERKSKNKSIYKGNHMRNTFPWLSVGFSQYNLDYEKKNTGGAVRTNRFKTYL